MPLVLPGSSRPSNLHLAPHQLRYELDGETLHWLENLPREVEQGERMFVVIQEDHERPYIIMEHADDHTEMFVMRCGHLGGDTYERLRYLRQVPLHKRLEVAEELERKTLEDYEKAQGEKLYENLGRPMRSQLFKDGFIDSFPTSYPKSPRKQAAGRPGSS